MNQISPFSSFTAATPNQFGVGQPVRRTEDSRFVAGNGEYTDDIVLPGQLYGFVLRSPTAHAKIVAIDCEDAKQAPGVLLVLTGTDLAVNDIPCDALMTNQDGTEQAQTMRPVLAADLVKFVGDGVAFVVAESLAEAQAAAELIEVTYDDLDVAMGTVETLEASQPQVHPEAPSNLAFDWLQGDAAAVESAFAKAAHVTKLELINNRVLANSMETRGVNASWDAETGRLLAYASTQGGWSLKEHMARATGLDEQQVKITTPDVGGGFGMKAFVYPEDYLVAIASHRLGRPVKWSGGRGESILSDVQGRDHVTTAELALDDDNEILGLRVKTYANMGAYLSQFGPAIPTECAVKVLPGVYDVKCASYNVVGTYTHTCPVDAYRGAGRPESIYMIERLIDQAARERGLSPDEMRARNMIKSAQLPFMSAVGELYDSGDFELVMREAMARADWGSVDVRRADAAARGKRLGLGMCYYIESTMGDKKEFADIRFEDDGTVSVWVGTQSNGQGHETAYAQVLAAKLGVPFEKVVVRQGDTDEIAWGGGTGGSRSLTIQAVAITEAGNSVIANAKELAAGKFETDVSDIEFLVADGAVAVAGTDLKVTLLDLARENPGKLNAREKGTIDAWTFPNGCHIAEVEIDEALGTTDVVRYTIVDDFGRLVNPLLVMGQVHGGVVQGIGQALFENVTYDETGQCVTGSFMDYAMPKADNMPGMDFHYIEILSQNNEMGIKGCGEAGTVASPGAVMNAIVDALWTRDSQSIPRIDMPATAEKLWRLMN